MLTTRKPGLAWIGLSLLIAVGTIACTEFAQRDRPIALPSAEAVPATVFASPTSALPPSPSPTINTTPTSLPATATAAPAPTRIPASASTELSGENERVRQAFAVYKRAILDGDGPSAALQVDQNTLDYYQEMLDVAIRADRDEVESLSFINKLMVLLIRHMIPGETALEMNGNSLFVHGVNQGWIGTEGVITSEMGEVTVFSQHAAGELVVGGRATSVSLVLRLEDDDWKIDLTELLAVANVGFDQIVRESGLPEDALIFLTLESISGRIVAEEIWDPIDE